MTGYAERTGLGSDRPALRYLWTDAFAVGNFLALARATAQPRFAEVALRLVDQVHHVLGRFRDDDPRTGWISGLDEREGEAHPTRGGLRIGKKLRERRPGEPFDERLEWDRDGRYFHYLSKWMHALDQVSRWTREPLGRRLGEVEHLGAVGEQRRIALAEVELSGVDLAEVDEEIGLEVGVATSERAQRPEQPSRAGQKLVRRNARFPSPAA
jgi:hypothetical protein